MKTTIACALILAGCASHSDKIDAAYISPLKYNSYTCSQLEQEYARVAQRSSIVNGQQDDIASNDAVAMGVGMVLFWPALFFIDSDDKKEEVARLKGEHNAIEQIAIQRECGLEFAPVTAVKGAPVEAEAIEEMD